MWNVANRHFRRLMRRAAKCAPIVLALTVLCATAAKAEDDWNKWSLSFYGGVGTNGGIEDLPGSKVGFEDSYLFAVTANRELTRFGDWLALEAEGQLVQHVSKQDHSEANILFALRWLPFPWDNTVETSFAFGDGLSYATDIPAIEKERSPGKNSHMLNYMMFELELAPPDEPHWSFIARVHHRSGVFGLFNDVSLGSNFYAAGVKYRF